MAGRPRRILDPSLAQDVKKHLVLNATSARALARRLNVNVSTVTRSLSEQSFSNSLRVSLYAEIAGVKPPRDASVTLREALHLLGAIDKIRNDAEVAVQLALDQLNASE